MQKSVIINKLSPRTFGKTLKNKTKISGNATTSSNSSPQKMSNLNKSKSQKQPRTTKNPSTFTKRKVARLGAQENENLDNFLQLKHDLKSLNKSDRKKSKVFFFSENNNRSENKIIEKTSGLADKVSKNRINKSSHNHCSCHLTGEDEVIGSWYQNKNLEHGCSERTKNDKKRSEKLIKKQRRGKALSNLDF